MANIASSKKDARRSARRATANRAVRSAVKTYVSKARRALTAGGEEAAELAKQAVSSLDRAASKGVLHRNNAARRKARLMRRLSATSAAAEQETPVTPTKKTGRGQRAPAAKTPAAAAPKPTRSRKASK